MPIQTLIAAANNGQMKGIALLNDPKMIKKYLAPLPATSKGRLTKQRSNVRSTKPKKSTRQQMEEEMSASDTTLLDTSADIIPLDEQASNVFCCAALADATEGTLYTDMTGSFLVQSLEGMHAFFVAYDYDTNMIFATPTKNLKDETIITAFEQVFNELEEKGFNQNLTSQTIRPPNQSRHS